LTFALGSDGFLGPSFVELTTEDQKIMKRFLLILSLSTSIIGCGELWKLVPIEPGSKPVISDYFAPQNVKPGKGWKIFLKAEDKDGDMKDIVATIAPAARSLVTYSFASIREEEGGSLAGYLFIKTPSSPSLQNEMFHLTIVIRDKTERKSNSVGFLLNFTSEKDVEVPQKWLEASNNRLGIIFTDYFNDYVRELESPRE